MSFVELLKAGILKIILSRQCDEDQIFFVRIAKEIDPE
ncbi:hypothetical protein RintRC_2188 [Richelia intracellularis]|nr:hypothetical protein RintRC_2188 [Richelia intracellularis]